MNYWELFISLSLWIYTNSDSGLGLFAENKKKQFLKSLYFLPKVLLREVVISSLQLYWKHFASEINPLGLACNVSEQMVCLVNKARDGRLPSLGLMILFSLLRSQWIIRQGGSQQEVSRLLASGAGTVSSGGEREIHAHGMEIYAWFFLC